MREWLRTACSTALRRLRSQARQSLAFAAIGALAASLTRLPEWIGAAQVAPAAQLLGFVARDVSAVFVAALVVVLALRLCTESGADLLRRPARFAIMLIGVTATATSVSLLWRIGLNRLLARQVAPPPPDEILYFWLQAMLWGALVGWLYLLTLQRAMDQQALAALQCRRALLARQLASARLGASRARVDPAMVAQVLAGVRARHGAAPERAAALLDELVRYLRLAMQRGQTASPEPDAELARIRKNLEEQIPCGPTTKTSASLPR